MVPYSYLEENMDVFDMMGNVSRGRMADDTDRQHRVSRVSIPPMTGRNRLTTGGCSNQIDANLPMGE